jgi:hypothetical protein
MRKVKVRKVKSEVSRREPNKINNSNEFKGFHK